MGKPRIPLQIANGLINVIAMVRIPNLRICGINKFFVDTGSPESFIGEQDANRLKVPMKNLNFTKPALMGGTKISLAQVKDVELTFKGEGDQPIKISPPDFHISKGVWTKSGIVYNNPSILGTDFLKSNNLMLVFCPSKGFAFLRKENGEEKEERSEPQGQTL